MKKMLAMILVLAMAVSLSACGGSGGSGETGTPGSVGDSTGGDSAAVEEFTPVTWKFGNQHKIGRAHV